MDDGRPDAAPSKYRERLDYLLPRTNGSVLFILKIGIPVLFEPFDAIYIQPLYITLCVEPAWELEAQ